MGKKSKCCSYREPYLEAAVREGTLPCCISSSVGTFLQCEFKKKKAFCSAVKSVFLKWWKSKVLIGATKKFFFHSKLKKSISSKILFITLTWPLLLEYSTWIVALYLVSYVFLSLCDSQFCLNSCISDVILYVPLFSLSAWIICFKKMWSVSPILTAYVYWCLFFFLK